MKTAILLMGPTAAGKTDVAMQLAQRFPCDLISVDSALVYRGMDIGTAKPSAETLASAPLQLIDIRDPEDGYSAGDFVRDAAAAMRASFANDRVPLLVGGTMMYFRALTRGMAKLPAANAAVRADIDREAEQIGWPAMHAKLIDVDPLAAKKLQPNDRQRIQRALEVFTLSGKPISRWQQDNAVKPMGISYLKIALQVEPRAILHGRIEARLDAMIADDFAAEVQALMSRPGLNSDCPSMRAVGYRQFWAYLDGKCSADEARNKALFATRQLAKRQLTWLRSENDLFVIDPLEDRAIDTISSHLQSRLA